MKPYCRDRDCWVPVEPPDYGYTLVGGTPDGSLYRIIGAFTWMFVIGMTGLGVVAGVLTMFGWRP